MHGVVAWFFEFLFSLVSFFGGIYKLWSDRKLTRLASREPVDGSQVISTCGCQSLPLRDQSGHPKTLHAVLSRICPKMVSLVLHLVPCRHAVLWFLAPCVSSTATISALIEGKVALSTSYGKAVGLIEANVYLVR